MLFATPPPKTRDAVSHYILLFYDPTTSTTTTTTTMKTMETYRRGFGKIKHTHTHKAAQQQTFNHIIYDFHRFHHYIMLKSGLYIFRVVFLDSKSSFSSFRIIIISNHILFPLSLFFSLSSLFSIKLYIYLLL